MASGGGKKRTTGDPASDRLRDLDSAMALIAHELRTPLSVLKGWADTLTHAARSLDQETLLTSAAAISRGADNMESIVRNMTDADEVGRGAVKLNLSDTLVSDFVGEVVEDLRTLVGMHTLTINVKDDVLLHIDSSSVRQILTNLVTNAVKFSPEGEQVALNVERRGDSVEIRVIDEGPGIDPSRYEELFIKFSRLDSMQKGAGLGLYISRGIARAHGGDLTLSEGSSGKGCTFVLTLPIHGEASEYDLPRGEKQRPR